MSKIFLLAVNLAWLGMVTAGAAGTNDNNDGQLFQFKFDANKPLIYGVDIKVRQVTDSDIGQRTSLTRTTTDTRYKMRLTAAGTNRDGTVVVYYEPFDYEQDSQTTAPSGQIDMTTRGLKIISKHNGIAMIDTEKGIGFSQAQTAKQAVYPHLLTGYMDFEPSGNIKSYEGDLAFIDTWQTMLKDMTNLFYIAFPTNALAVNDSWTNYYGFKTIGPIAFSGDGITQAWDYVRGPDQATTNGPIASFTVYMSSNYKDLDAYLDQFGQQTAMNIPQYTESINSTYQFDQKRGYLVSETQSENLHQDMSMMVQGNAGTSHGDTERNVSIVLLSP